MHGEGMNVRVGWVGVGDMGMRMVVRILAAGLEPVVFDVNPDAATSVERRGAVVADSVADLADRSEVVFVCVAFDEQLRSVVLGSGGILEHVDPGSVVVVHSTAPPATIQLLAREAATRGVDLLDAPVSGGTYGAEEGTLTVLAGGAESVLERVSPLMDAYADQVFLMGEPGTGQVAKLINNLLLASNRVAVIESLRLARAYELDVDQLMAAISVSTGASYVQQHWEQLGRHRGRLDGPATPQMLDRAAKDLRYALSAGRARFTYLPVAALIAELLPSIMAELDATRAIDAPPGTESSQ